VPGSLPDSVLLFEDGTLYQRSTAALRIMRGLRAPWPARVFPPRAPADSRLGVRLDRAPPLSLVRPARDMHGADAGPREEISLAFRYPFTVSYRTPLEARIAKQTTRAITEFGLIEDGDRVMVGLSGGKDSWALMQILHVLRERAPIDFSIVGVNVNSGYADFQHDLVTKACAERGWECLVEHTAIGAVMDDILDDGETPCSLCARLRRGVLYRMKKAVGATKIALGHHLDDFVETVLLNLFFQGSLKAMPARLVSDNKQHIVIRPLAYVTEAEARAYTRECELPVIGCCCPACGDLSLKRQRIKRLIAELEIEHPDIKNSMIKALGNVAPSHLLDTRLNPIAEVTAGLAAIGVSRA
jgi:tRNA 2-thiocytidine biosynthesis protein TtcA